METCRKCNAPLKWAFEIENTNLCTNCGPGSLHWQEKYGDKTLEEVGEVIGDVGALSAKYPPPPTTADDENEKQKIKDLYSGKGLNNNGAKKDAG